MRSRGSIAPRESNGTFYYLGSNNNPGNNITSIPWGTIGDVPIPGDYDGDGKMDAAIKRDGGAGQNQIWILRSGDGGHEVIGFGNTTDTVVPGDYDLDGKSDLMMARSGGLQMQWWLLTRQDVVTVNHFGSATDTPIAGDHDGDGKSDVSVWRGSTGQFWLLRSSDNGVQVANFGTTGDIPVGAAYVN